MQDGKFLNVMLLLIILFTICTLSAHHQELFEFHDGRAPRTVQKFATSHLHFVAAGDSHLRAGKHGLFGSAEQTRNDCIECNRSGKIMSYAIQMITSHFEFAFFFRSRLQTFGNKLLAYGAWVIPLMVAVSAFGGLCVHIMASSRMCFVGARNGHMPSLLSYINIKNYTPVPSLVFLVS